MMRAVQSWPVVITRGHMAADVLDIRYQTEKKWDAKITALSIATDH